MMWEAYVQWCAYRDLESVSHAMFGRLARWRDIPHVNMSYENNTCHMAWEAGTMRIWSFVQQKGGSGKSTI